MPGKCKLTALVRSSLARFPARGHLWLGYSGGLDSTVLLHLLATLGVPFTAVHIHHGLSPRADGWRRHCQDCAAGLSVPFITRSVSVQPADGGLEQGARNARYRAFAECMAAGDQILLAHHGNDQVETFFLRLLRGAGVLGLAAMAEQRTMGDGKSVLRPLLGATRWELEQYAHRHGLCWIEDDSNQDQSIERNYLRRQVTPRLAERWPVVSQVARASEHLREAAELMAEVAAEDLGRCEYRRERFGESVQLPAFRLLSASRQRNLLRYWVQQEGGRIPESAQVAEVLAQLDAVADATPAVALGGLVVRRFRNRLYLTPQLETAESTEDGEVTPWQWDGVRNLVLPGGWELAPGPCWPAGDYSVRFRRGGERAQPAQRRHSQTLKKLLQEFALEPWLRGSVPLIYQGEVLLGVGDLFVTAEGPPKPPIWRFSD
ncbi:tRNA lysidine(34) synthetase TilS [Microbulbifer celer]|uniref:tRNA(Ile)-lysidine synthase n=1 Tax=Microbulbifer celer TaxID=435905 RepID=A0ABW3UEX8_9GAMM|nr:tRNA lysidine(34) synthetase TilS [Microbulbifer celer]UFN55801.1 tRNA lysidine(34) synthetase TilS [Microbulbifer celer]